MNGRWTGAEFEAARAATGRWRAFRGQDTSEPGPSNHVMRPEPDTMYASSPSARYDGGIATSPGVSTPPANSGAALENALAGMVGDVRNRASSFPEVPVPGMPTNSETQTVIVRDSAGGSKAVLIGTLFCVAAAGVTLYRAAKKKKGARGE